MKVLHAAFLVVVCILALSLRAKADDAPTLMLDPTTGAVTGPALSTVGWGFTLTAGSSDFAVITGSDFCVGMVSSPCSNSFGTYTDFIGSQFVVVGNNPGESPVTEPFDDASMSGVGSFYINPSSTGTITGFLALTYDLYSVDPNAANFNPTIDTLSVGDYLYAPASVTVRSNTMTAPETGSGVMLIGGMAGLLFLARRRGKLTV